MFVPQQPALTFRAQSGTEACAGSQQVCLLESAEDLTVLWGVAGVGCAVAELLGERQLRSLIAEAQCTATALAQAGAGVRCP